MRPGTIAAAPTTLLLVLGCGEAKDQPSEPATPSDPGVIHIHGLGRNPADDALFIATHTGLFRMTSSDPSPERVAGLYQDTMGFTVVGPDHSSVRATPAAPRTIQPSRELKGTPMVGAARSRSRTRARSCGAGWRASRRASRPRNADVDRGLLLQADSVGRSRAGMRAQVADGARRCTVPLELERTAAGWVVTELGT